MPTVSVIIPCYNSEKYIMRCWESICSQTFGADRIETIFIDDASEDGTWEILQKIEREDPRRITVIRQEENAKQGTARNLGLSYATAPYIMFVDSDDWVDKDLLEQFYEIILENDCDFVCCNLCRDYGDGRTYEIRRYEQSTLRVINDDAERGALLVSGGLDRGPCAKLIKKEFLLQNEIFFPEGIRYEDICWGALLYPYVKSFYALARSGYHYYVNAESTVLKKGQEYYRDLFTSNYVKFDEWKRRGFFERMPRETEFDFLVDYYLTILKLFGKRFDAIPADDFREMQVFLCDHFPDCQTNPYIHKYLKSDVAILFDLINRNLQEKELAKLHQILQKINF